MCIYALIAMHATPIRGENFDEVLLCEDEICEIKHTQPNVLQFMYGYIN